MKADAGWVYLYRSYRPVALLCLLPNAGNFIK